MKRIICCLMALLLVFVCGGCGAPNTNGSSHEQTTTAKPGADNNFELSAKDFVSGITAGFNLGNTLDACYSWGDIPKNNPTPEQIETGWNNPVTTQEMFDAYAAEGFNAARIPVTWYLSVTESDGKYTISDEWMNRVKEVVGYAQKNKMYVIVDMHHEEDGWLSIAGTDSEFEAVKEQYRQLWGQIAAAFKDYDEKLILEAANEIIYKAEDGEDWWGKESWYFDRLNELYQIFVDTVRSSGGNNDRRYLMLPTYGAQWYSQQMKPLLVPNNDQRVIIDIHWYTMPQQGADMSAYTDEVKGYIQGMYDNIMYYDWPLVLGECGPMANAATSLKVSWTKTVARIAYQYGIKCFIWDDGGNFMQLDRRKLEWTDDSFISAFVEAATAKYEPIESETETEQEQD